MKKTRMAGALLTLSVFTPLLLGCGGGNGTTNTLQSNPSSVSDGTSRGALTMQIHFPSGKSVKAASSKAGNSGRTRVAGFSNGNIPEGTQAVKVEVITTSSPETSLGLPQIVTSTSSQTGGNVAGPATVRFTNLPVGTVRVRATAYPDILAQLTPLAVGTSDVAIAANSVANTNIALTLTIDHIVVTPTSLTLGFQTTTNRATFMATPMTVDNKPLLMALQVTSNRPDVARANPGTRPLKTPAETSVYSVQTVDPTFASLPVTATITVAEPNSGKTAAITANIVDDSGE